jgi:translocation and assembly module TamB
LRQRDLYAFWIEAEIDDCLLVNVPDVRAVFDGRVRLEGSTQEGKLSGKLEVVSADLGIPEEMSSSVPKIDVVYINQPVYEPVPQLFPPVSERWILGLDLNVRAPGQTFVRGRGLTSEWEGEGRLRGSTADPMVYGKLSLVRGDYNFIGRIFTLTHGDVQFNGLPGLSTLNVSAELAMEGLTAEAFLHGPIREPQLRLSSNPSRPVKDILARILFDKEVGDISPLQGLELAQTLLSITSTGKGPDFVGNLRRSIGLDRLDISHNSMDPNEVAVHAGKYIARGVFVSINKAVNSSNNELAIEMRLSDQVKVEGRLGDEVGSKVSLKWKKDY